MKNFALTGVGGYIAPRHLQAIRDTGNRLIAALDPHDAVGILDRYFEEVAYFREFERFDRFADKVRRRGETERIHFVSICAPNYLHDAHVRFALRIGADAICEKPLVLNPWNLEALSELEAETGRRVFAVLQLRLHPAIIALRERVALAGARHHALDLTYITSRGNWYFTSWKGDIEKSGGIAANIGIHFFDMLIWIFGPVKGFELHLRERERAGGILFLEKATVRWFLSLEKADIPEPARSAGRTTFRSLMHDGQEVEFSEGFGDLHTDVYRNVLSGSGFGIADAQPSISLVYGLRQCAVNRGSSEYLHPLSAAHLLGRSEP